MIHKVFLTWLIYFVIVILVGAGLCYLGIPQIAIMSDHSYLTTVLLGMYAISEILSARQAWKMSSELLIAQQAKEWLKSNNMVSLVFSDETVLFLSNTATHTVKPSETANHFIALRDMAANGHKVDQSILLDVLSDRLNSKISFIEFVAGRVVWVGILATILGVILAFWPLLSGDMSVDTIRLKLGGFFSGIAVAFIPTAASFVFKIALDFGTNILNNAADEIVNLVARGSETKILPFLEKNSK